MVDQKKKLLEINNSEEFLEIINCDSRKDKLILVDFFAEWCGPCLKLGNFLHKLIEADKDKQYDNVLFLKVNIDNDECCHLVDRFQIQSIPRVVMLKNKKVVSDITGCDPNKILDDLKKCSVKTNVKSKRKD